MEKNKLKFNKNSAKKYAARFVVYRKLFFAIFFCILFIFTFNVIYKNVYYNMKHIDYAKSGNFENNETEKNTMFEKVIEDIKVRKQATQDAENRKYGNPFGSNDTEILDRDDESENSNNNDNGENNNEDNNNDDSNNGNPIVLPVESPVPIEH